jgi:hypothetical protein
MNAFQVVTEKITEVTKLAVGLLDQAAAGLVNKARELSLDTMSRRLDGALRALRGETSLQIAQKMVDSYTFDERMGVCRYTVPAGVTEVKAMKALNKYFRKHLPGFNRDAVYAGHLKWFENLPRDYPTHCGQRDYSQDRQITIAGVVKGAEREDLTTQGSGCRDDSVGLSDPRDKAIAAALHACKHGGRDLFTDLSVHESVPMFEVDTDRHLGIVVFMHSVVYDYSDGAAPYSLPPESEYFDG